MLTNEIIRLQAEAQQDYVIESRRTIHRFAEVSGKEFKTSAFIEEEIKKAGLPYEKAGDTGWIAILDTGKPGSRIALRADIDALLVPEEPNNLAGPRVVVSDDPHTSHACGHDAHTAMLLGAARLLKENQDEIEGTIKLVFQPDEEGFTGSKKMIKAGVLENPKVDAALAMHVHSGTPSNVVLCGLGTSIAGCNRFRIVVKGKGCHGAMPETGIDPINIAAHIYLAIQTILTREISATESAVVTIGKFVGGDVPNVIPEEVVMEGTIRSLDKEVGEFIFDRMNEIVTSTAKMLRGEAELIELSSVPPLANNDELAHELTGYMKDIVGEKAVVLFEQGGMGSEDFASYSYEVPSVYIMLGAGTKQENSLYGEAMHNEKVVFNEDILPTGAAIHAYSAIMWLKNNK